VHAPKGAEGNAGRVLRVITSREMNPVLRPVLFASSVLVLAACDAGSAPEAERATTRGSPQPTPALDSCPVTIPNESGPPGEQSGEAFHREGLVWVELWPDGILRADPSFVEPDGSIWMKLPWWAHGVGGRLRIEGRRLDGPGRPVRATVNAGWPRVNANGNRFWSSAVVFSTEGCWEVTGRLETASLTFVVLVVKDVSEARPVATPGSTERGTRAG
jgi:hypothetical protein